MKTRNAHDELVRVQATTDYLLQRSEDGWVIGHFFNNRLSSVFQPVLDVNGRQIIGHAAYIRSGVDHVNVLSPWGIFALAAEDTLLVNLDRLCRTMHAINYFSTASGPGNLFVSVQPRLLESVKDDHGRAFAEVLDLIGVATSRVVIEIPVEVNRDWRLLRHVISNYRSRGAIGSRRITAVQATTGYRNWEACIRTSSGRMPLPCCNIPAQIRCWKQFIASEPLCWCGTSKPASKCQRRFGQALIYCRVVSSGNRPVRSKQAGHVPPRVGAMGHASKRRMMIKTESIGALS